MDSEIFYVYPQKGTTKDHKIIPDREYAIAAKFLMVNGKYIVDPNADGSQQVQLYGRLDAHGRIDETSTLGNSYNHGNPNNYLIVPAKYDPAEAKNLAAHVNRDGAVLGSLAMFAAFLPGHKQDLQRGERWGIPDGERSPAFRDGTSSNFGAVTQMTILPDKEAVVGAGLLNLGEHVASKIRHPMSTPPQKLDGPFDMSEIDYKAFLQGVQDAQGGKKISPGALAKALRAHIRNGVRTGEKTLHDLALDLGRPGLGGFAPVGRVAPPSSKTAPRPHDAGGAALPAARQSGQQGGSSAPGGGKASATDAPGYKAVLAQAKALAAQQRQSRQAASNGMYPAPSGNGLEGISFAPIGAHGLGPAARFAARTAPSAASAETLMSTPAHFGEGALAPRRPLDQAAVRAAAARAGGHATSDTSAAMTAPVSSPGSQAQFGHVLDDYFFRQSRLPPRGGAPFNALLSPLWAGLQIPG